MYRIAWVGVILAAILAARIAGANTCGNGILESGEQCDDGANNGTAVSCCTATCTFEPPGTPCTGGTCSGNADTCVPTTTTTTTTTTSTLPPTPVTAVCPLGQDPCLVTSAVTINPGSTLDFGQRALVVTPQGSLDIGSGLVKILAGSLDIQPKGAILGNGGGWIMVTTTGPIVVEKGTGTRPLKGTIDMSSSGGGGEIDLTAGDTAHPANITIAGILNASGVSNPNADGGKINITANNGNVTITSDGGDVYVISGNLGSGGTIDLQSPAGGIQVTNLLDAGGGDFNGGAIDMSAHADIAFGALNVSASATGSGGIVNIMADGNITANGPISGQGSGTGGNGGDGASVRLIATGSLQLNAPILTASGDGGSGGSLDIEATNGSLLIAAPIDAHGVGTAGCGGAVKFVSGTDTTLTPAMTLMDISGGPTCEGGRLSATAGGTTTISGEINADHNLGFIGPILAPTIVVNAGANLHANVGPTERGGEVNLFAHDALTLAAGAQLSSAGPGGLNLLQSCGTMNVQAKVSAVAGVPTPLGQNDVQYWQTIPVVNAANFNPAPVITGALAACAPPPTTTTTTISVCGNGVVESGEQCDDGAANGQPTSCCSSTCQFQPSGTVCNDGNACTTGDHCTGGTCAGAPVVCTASDQCHTAGTCDPGSGTCSNPSKPDGVNCDDGNKCTTGDQCRSGVCMSGAAVVCTASDQCHTAGSCNPGTGTCSNPSKPDGASCDDGSKCTAVDQCQGGQCVGGSPVVCSALDQCHRAGTCDSGTGACSNPARSDGTPCDDGNACTLRDACQAGACVGGAPANCDDGDPCTTDSCDPVNGCNHVSVSGCRRCNTAADCADGNPCTDDACQGGTCVYTNNTASCDDGNKCTTGDQCQGGQCRGTPVSCGAADQCHTTGICDPSTGACFNPSKPDGTACDDGNECTTDDRCTAGICAGTRACVCGNGTIEPGEDCDDGANNGQLTSCCSRTCQFQATGTACADDGDLCTQDVCAGTADTCTHPIAPSLGCLTPTVPKGASLLLRTVRGRNQAQMQWGKGPAVALGDFGGPTRGNGTQLCVYESSGPGTYALALSGSPSVIGGGTWKGSKTGWTFKSKTGAPDGITGVTLRAGAAHKAKLQVKAKGNPAFPAGLPLTPAVVAQFKTSAGECFGATFSLPSVLSATEFKAKSD
jgi:cysteine-rich repeat protein